MLIRGGLIRVRHLWFLTEVPHETVAWRPLAQPSRRFVGVGSLSLWRGILRSLAQPFRHLAWTEILLWDLLQRSSAENLFRQFVEMAFHRDLAQQLLQRTCQGDLAHDLPQRSSQRELVESDLVSFLHVPCNTVWCVLPRSFFSYVWTEPLDVTVRPTETKAMPFRSVAMSPDSARLSGTQVDPWANGDMPPKIRWFTLVYPVSLSNVAMNEKLWLDGVLMGKSSIKEGFFHCRVWWPSAEDPTCPIDSLDPRSKDCLRFWRARSTCRSRTKSMPRQGQG